MNMFLFQTKLASQSSLCSSGFCSGSFVLHKESRELKKKVSFSTDQEERKLWSKSVGVERGTQTVETETEDRDKDEDDHPEEDVDSDNSSDFDDTKILIDQLEKQILAKDSGEKEIYRLEKEVKSLQSKIARLEVNIFLFLCFLE